MIGHGKKWDDADKNRMRLVFDHRMLIGIA